MNNNELYSNKSPSETVLCLSTIAAALVLLKALLRDTEQKVQYLSIRRNTPQELTIHQNLTLDQTYLNSYAYK